MRLVYFAYMPSAHQWVHIDRAAYYDSIRSLWHWAERPPAPSQLQDEDAIPPEFKGFALLMTVGAEERPDTAVKLSDFDRAHVGQILADDGLKYTNYSAHLLRLLPRADLFQRECLRMIYPEHVEAFEAWQRGPYQPELKDIT